VIALDLGDEFVELTVGLGDEGRVSERFGHVSEDTASRGRRCVGAGGLGPVPNGGAGTLDLGPTRRRIEGSTLWWSQAAHALGAASLAATARARKEAP